MNSMYGCESQPYIEFMNHNDNLQEEQVHIIWYTW